MLYEFEYSDSEERATLLDENKGSYLIAEKNIEDGNFLIFTDIKPVEVEIEELKQENELLKARDKALSERADFIEDVVAEMATQVYQ